MLTTSDKKENGHNNEKVNEIMTFRTRQEFLIICMICIITDVVIYPSDEELLKNSKRHKSIEFLFLLLCAHTAFVFIDTLDSVTNCNKLAVDDTARADILINKPHRHE